MLRIAFRHSDLECVEGKNKDDYPYSSLREYEDLSGEHGYMTNFDSFMHNSIGLGVIIPIQSENKDKFTVNHWYDFENN